MQTVSSKRVLIISMILINLFFLLASFVFFVIAQSVDIFESDPFAVTTRALITFIILLIGLPVMFFFNIIDLLKVIKDKKISLIPFFSIALFIVVIFLNFIDFKKF